MTDQDIAAIAAVKTMHTGSTQDIPKETHRESVMLCALIMAGHHTAVFGGWFRQDLAAASGLNSTTVRKLMNGGQATKAQKAAMCWALVENRFSLYGATHWEGPQ